MDFNTAFTILLGNEGGYTVDSGGPTNWGISQRAYPQFSTEQIQTLTQDQAKKLYLRDYWGPSGADSVPDVLKFQHFDFAVNAGARTAIKTLQRAAGMTPNEADGVLGPHSLMSVGKWDPYRLLGRYAGQIIAYYTHVQPPLWATNGKGWMNRLSANLLR